MAEGFDFFDPAAHTGPFGPNRTLSRAGTWAIEAPRAKGYSFTNQIASSAARDGYCPSKIAHIYFPGQGANHFPQVTNYNLVGRRPQKVGTFAHKNARNCGKATTALELLSRQE